MQLTKDENIDFGKKRCVDEKCILKCFVKECCLGIFLSFFAIRYIHVPDNLKQTLTVIPFFVIDEVPEECGSENINNYAPKYGKK